MRVNMCESLSMSEIGVATDGRLGECEMKMIDATQAAARGGGVAGSAAAAELGSSVGATSHRAITSPASGIAPAIGVQTIDAQHGMSAIPAECIGCDAGFGV